MGGAIVQVFAHEYPGEVAGLVLVDPGDGRLDKLLRSKLPPEIWSARQKALTEEMPKLPEAVRREYEALEASGDQAARAFPLPSVPIILLSGTKKNPRFPGNPVEQDLKLEGRLELGAVVGPLHELGAGEDGAVNLGKIALGVAEDDGYLADQCRRRVVLYTVGSDP